MKIPTVLVGVIPLGVFCFTGVCAQSTASSGTTASDASALEEIVVTSRKREENLQDVPVAISAFANADLERLQTRDSVDLSGAAPNFFIKQNPTTTVSPSIYIRGIGQDESHFTSENGVGLYVDGVYLPRASGSIVELLDLERVEILRGPQGTLFGKNSPAGALVLVSRLPSLDNPGGKITVSAGNYNALGGNVSMETPLIDGQLATKVDFGGRSNDGWMFDKVSGETVNGITKYAGRVSTLWVPDDQLSLNVIADASKDRSQPYAPTYVNGRTPVYSLFETNIAPDFNHDQQFDGFGLSATANYKINSNWSLRSISAYRRFTHKLWGDLFGAEAFSVALSRDQTQHQVSQEFQLNWQADHLNVVFGAIYFAETNHEVADNEFAGGGDQYPISEQKTDSYAAFTEGTYNFTNAFSLTLGGRVGTDKKTMNRISTDAPGGTGAIVAYDVRDLSKKWTEFTPRVILQFKPLALTETSDVDRFLTYLSGSRGYKAGGFDPAFTGNQALASFIYDPEKVTAYEFGVKSDWLERRLRANVAYFFNKYQNYQTVDCTFGANSVCRAGSFDINMNGFEAELSAVAAPGLTFSANLATLHNDIKSGIDVGKQLKDAPKLTYFFSAEFDHSIEADWRFLSSVQWHWTSKYYNDLQNGIEGLTDAYGLLNGYVGIGKGDRWSARIYGKNITNKEYIANALTGGSWWVGQPRTYGVTFNYKL